MTTQIGSFTLGILETGRPPTELADRYAAYPQMFMDLLGGAAPKEWTYRSFACLEDEFPHSPNECDAWLITGSKFGVYDEQSWIQRLLDFTREAFNNDVPLIGICFGHQAIAKALGGVVEKSEKGWGLGNHAYFWNRDLDQLSGQLPLPPGDGFVIQAYHQDQVLRLPADAVTLASSDFCPNAAFVIDDRVLTFQGHPEMGRDFITSLIHARRGTIVSEEIADQALKTQALDNDRALIGKTIVDFLKLGHKNNKQHKKL